MADSFKTCANCGADVPEGSRFCDNCGMPLSEASSSWEAPRQEDSIREAPSSSPTPPPSQSPPLPPPPPVEPPPISVPPPPRRDGRLHRGLLILGGGFVAALLVIGGAIWGLVSYSQDEPSAGAKTVAPPDTVGAVAGTADEGTPAEDPGPSPGYQLVENDARNLSVEVPSGWRDVYTGYDGTFEGEDVDVGVGPAITATPDMSVWITGGPVPGMYVVASRELAWEYDEDRLAASGFNDRSPCEAGERQDFDRPPYSGRIQSWDCVEDGSTLFTLGAAPENRECVVMLQIKTYNEADREAAQHILDTFEAGCEGIT